MSVKEASSRRFATAGFNNTYSVRKLAPVIARNGFEKLIKSGAVISLQLIKAFANTTSGFIFEDKNMLKTRDTFG